MNVPVTPNLESLTEEREERVADVPPEVLDRISEEAHRQHRYTWEQLGQNPKLWVSLLWQAMARRGGGYRRHSLRHTGKDDDRRKDKLEGPEAGKSKFFRSYARLAVAPIKRTPRQLRRARAAIMGGK